MNTKMKWVYLFTLMISFIFQSCEKDFNEEPQVKEQAKEGIINHVTINDVPFLKPNVESFQSNNLLTGKFLENGENKVELDLDHIIEYEGTDDFKSYTIPVVGAGVENEDYYFENLHILKDEDKYESFVVRYFPYDKTKKFELNHFTGKMEFFDENKTLKIKLYFENGEVKKAENAIENSTTGKTNIIPDRAEDDDCNCGPTGGGSSLLSQFFSWISGLFSNIRISLGSGGYYSGDGSYTGDYYLSVTSPTGGSGSYPGDGNSNSGGSGNPTVVFVPSQVQAEYQRIQVVDIVRKLGTIDATAFLWMMNPNNADDVNNVYYVLNEKEDNTPETLEFLRQAIIVLKAGGEVDYWFRVIIDKSLREDTCLYDIYTKLGQAPKFDSYLKKFDSKFSVVDLSIKADSQFGTNFKENINSQAITLLPVNKTIEIIINKDPNLPSNIKKFPKISIATNIIHEIIHAEIYRQLASASRDANINPQKMSDTDWKYYLNNLKNDFPKMFEYYSKYVLNTKTPTDFQHQYIADKYRSVIKEALKQYDGNKHNEDFYNALSWNGLKNTTAWNQLSDAERTNILQAIQTIYRDEVYCN